MAEDASTFRSRRAANSFAKTAVSSLICTLCLTAWSEPARGDTAVPDIALRPSTAAKQDANDAKKRTRVPAKAAKIESKRSDDKVPDIVLQRMPTQPNKIAPAASGATAGSPSSASPSQNLAAETPKVSPTEKSAAPSSAKQSQMHTARLANSGAQQSNTAVRLTGNTEHQPPAEIHLASPIDAAAYTRFRAQSIPQQANFQTEEPLPGIAPANPATTSSKNQDPCAAIGGRPFYEFGINTAVPDGQLPTDIASACWVSVNSAAGPLAGQRCWATSMYAWDATCLCHRPLYFEEANLERYGYGCCETLQPAASAAHFFGTIPLLPYCMAVDCPSECIYTLGHYRPGSCAPKRYMWPPCSPRAILAEGGMWTAMVFLIP